MKQLRAAIDILQAVRLWCQAEDWAAAIPCLESLKRLDALRKVRTSLGLEEEGPPLVPPQRALQDATSHGAQDAQEGEPLREAVEIMQSWIEGQEAVLATVSRLWAAGFTGEVHVLAAALEQAGADVRGHLVHERAVRAEAERRLDAMLRPAPPSR